MKFNRAYIHHSTHELEITNEVLLQTRVAHHLKVTNIKKVLGVLVGNNKPKVMYL